MSTLARNIVFSVAALSFFTLLPAAAASHPNIILILADDLGYGDCPAYHLQSKIKTPHIDQLAKEGLRFTDAHSAASTCTPSRYGLLTGINPARTGVLNTLLSQGKPIISKNEKTIAHLLKSQGYSTHMIGKWHLGFDTGGMKKSYDFDKAFIGGPLDRGFDSYFGIHSSPGDFPLFYLKDRNAVAKPSQKASWEKMQRHGKSTTRIKGLKSADFELDEASPTFCQKAISLIKDQAESEAPFFLYYASPIPHSPWVPSKAFKGKSGLGDYGDFVMQLDDVVGQINTALKQSGLAENTLLIFTSDNGPGPHATRIMANSGHACAGSLRGSKASLHEGGHRVPFIAKWPGKIPASKNCTATINFTDFFATLAEYFEIDHSSQYPGVKDSHSFLPTLLDPVTSHSRPPMINGYYSIRQGDWKLLTKRKYKRADFPNTKHGQFLLHNLSSDPAENKNLSNPGKFRDLSQKLRNFVKEQKPK